MVNDGRDEVGDDRPGEGRFVDGEHRFPLRVYFEDTDLSGVVYHANYLRFLERARSDMLRLAGVDQRATFEAGGGAYAVADLRIRFARPARLDDVILILSRVRDVRAAGVVIHQRVMRGEAMLAEAEVTAALVGPGGRPRRQPPDWIDAFHKLTGQGERPNA